MAGRPQVVDFFSGCGGTSLGLQDAGMEVVAAIDSDVDACDSFRLNFPDASVHNIKVEELDFAPIADRLDRSRPLVFSGCAPCQPFSKQNRHRSSDDPRRNLLAYFADFVRDHRPEGVLVENVPGMQKIGHDGPFGDFQDMLEDLGYSVTTNVLTALDYGVPQTRRRLVLLASANGEITMPETTHGPGKSTHRTVRDAIAGLPSIDAGQTDPEDPDHASMKLSPLNLRRIQATPEGGGRQSWPTDLVPDCHSGYTGHSDVYGRLAWDKPAVAMTTRCISYSNGRFGHPEQDRALSLREAACIQTFPRSSSLSGSLTSKARQIGNAVPPSLARRLGESLIAAM